MELELRNKVHTLVRSARIAEAVHYLEQGLGNCVSTRFKVLIGANFTNDPREIARSISGFIDANEKCFAVQAVYLEMNGFDINVDRWYHDYFGYRRYVDDPEDLDWLCAWDSEMWPETTLTGLESVQNDFDWYTSHRTQGYKDEKAKEAAEFAVLLVMCKFAILVEKAMRTGIVEKRIPILATAHDFDIVARFNR